jgi:hypothetical protein
LTALASSMGLAGSLRIMADFKAELKPSLYAACDVFVSPADNQQETFGLTILEAMAAGKPVVASDFSGYRDLVSEGETGYLIPTIGPASFDPLDAARPVLPDFISALQSAQRTALDLGVLLDRLGRLAASPELRLEMGRAGRQRVRQYFDWPLVMARMLEGWRGLKSRAEQSPVRGPSLDVGGAGQKRLFGHFVTRGISGDDRLSLGPLAAAFSAGSWAEAPPIDLGGNLPRAGLARILELLKASGEPVKLAGLQAGLDREMPPHMVEHLALYGLKYGVLALAGA